MESPVEIEQESKPQAFPQAILNPVQWMEVRRSVEVGGLTVREASEAHKVSYDAVRQRALREDWLTPAKIAEKLAQKEREAQEQALSQVVATKVGDLPNEANKPQMAVTASSARLSTILDYKDRGLLKLARVADNALEQAVRADLPVENWQDVKIASEIFMKLHQVGQDAVQVNICNAFADMDEGKLIETDAEIVGDEESRDSYFIDSE